MSQPTAFFPFNLLDQTINPMTTWFSPNYEINFAGNKPLEQKITADVASYGRQLGIVIEAVLKLAQEQGTELSRLKELQEELDRVKCQYHGKLQNRIEKDLAQLKIQDADAYNALLAKLKK